jgi:hypothetical protein
MKCYEHDMRPAPLTRKQPNGEIHRTSEETDEVRECDKAKNEGEIRLRAR